MFGVTVKGITEVTRRREFEGKVALRKRIEGETIFPKTY